MNLNKFQLSLQDLLAGIYIIGKVQGDKLLVAAGLLVVVSNNFGCPVKSVALSKITGDDNFWLLQGDNLAAG